jgi:iron complex outermembrane receptor protein
LAGHYSGEQYGNLDNSDTEGGYGGIDEFLVFDAKFSYRFSSSWLAAVGVDNITDELYHVSHPYPMRTFLAELKYTF